MDLEIAAESRSATGKRNRQLRRTGQLPGVVYGKDTDSLAIQVEAKAFDTLFRAAGRTSRAGRRSSASLTGGLSGSMQGGAPNDAATRSLGAAS